MLMEAGLRIRWAHRGAEERGSPLRVVQHNSTFPPPDLKRSLKGPVPAAPVPGPWDPGPQGAEVGISEPEVKYWRPSFCAVRNESGFPVDVAPDGVHLHVGQNAARRWQPPIPQSRGRRGATSTGPGPLLRGVRSGRTLKRTRRAPGSRTATLDVRAGNRRRLPAGRSWHSRRLSGPVVHSW